MAARGYWHSQSNGHASLDSHSWRRKAGRRGERPSSMVPSTPYPKRSRRSHTDYDLAGYRNRPVYIKTRHVPPSYDAARDLMPVFFELLTEDPSAPSVRSSALLLRFHPPVYGWQRQVARFLLTPCSSRVAIHGLSFQWSGARRVYGRLGRGSGDGNIQPFARFIASCLALIAVIRPAKNGTLGQCDLRCRRKRANVARA